MNNTEAERSVICSILIKPKTIDDVSDILESRDFSDVSYGMIFGTLKDMDIGLIDTISLAQELSARGVLEHVGGMAFLTEIHNSVSTPANAKSYAKIIKEQSNIKALKVKLTTALAFLNESSNFDESVSRVNSILAETEVSSDGYMPFKELIKSRVADLQRRLDNGGGFEGLSTGFKAMDEKIMGLKPGDYFVIGARPSIGKTAFSLALAANMAKSDGDVLYFSAESTKESLADRMITATSSVESKYLRAANLDQSQWASYHAGVPLIMELPVHVIDISSIDILHAQAIARKFNRKKKVKAIFVDYIQLMTCKGTTGDFEAVSNISRGLKKMAKECDCPVIALAQLSRGVEQRNDKRPVLSDLRSTGQIEQDADYIGFLYRDEYYNEDTYDQGITEFSMRKSRDGETFKQFFKSELSKMRYTEINYTSQEKESYTPFARNK